MSKIDLREIGEDISEGAYNAKKMYKKAKRLSPSMKKEITVKTQYFSHKKDSRPCAQSLLQFNIDCSLIKLMLCLFLIMCACSLFCMMKRKKRHCKGTN